MKRQHVILKGAFILTATGFLTRIIGFFYRIFLSQKFGEEGVGIYQLIFPVFALGYSLTCAGLETAISRTVAGKASTGNHSQARSILYTGLTLSFLLSCAFMLFIQKNATHIATSLLNEPRCEHLLFVLSYTFPFASLHSCICGFYLGLKKAEIPAISQIIEQIFRVLSVFLLYKITIDSFETTDIVIAVAGLFVGEFASSLFCIFYFHHVESKTFISKYHLSKYFINAKELLTLSLPLTGSRVLLNLLQSIEAVSIPLKLQIFGFTTSESLSIYGVLTGMALPLILFPSAVTNSIASMLLPTVAEIQTQDNKHEINIIIKKVVFYCFSLGIVCCVFLITFGPFVGNILFHSELAGEFIITLAWMCPFLYTNGNLISIINGLGKTMHSFIFNAIGLSIRILSVFFLIPIFGIRGYLLGLLLSQLVIFSLCISYSYIFLHKSKNQGL